MVWALVGACSWIFVFLFERLLDYSFSSSFAYRSTKWFNLINLVSLFSRLFSFDTPESSSGSVAICCWGGFVASYLDCSRRIESFKSFCWFKWFVLCSSNIFLLIFSIFFFLMRNFIIKTMLDKNITIVMVKLNPVILINNMPRLSWVSASVMKLSVRQSNR